MLCARTLSQRPRDAPGQNARLPFDMFSSPYDGPIRQALCLQTQAVYHMRNTTTSVLNLQLTDDGEAARRKARLIPIRA